MYCHITLVLSHNFSMLFTRDCWTSSGCILLVLLVGSQVESFEAASRVDARLGAMVSIPESSTTSMECSAATHGVQTYCLTVGTNDAAFETVERVFSLTKVSCKFPFIITCRSNSSFGIKYSCWRKARQVTNIFYIQ